MASALRKAQTHDDRVHKSRKVKVTILASEWRSGNGGLSTINRELAIQLAKFPEVETTFFLPKCSQEDKNVALDHKVTIVEATPLSCFEELDWLCYPPDDLEIDIVVGHGIRLGKQAQVIKKSKTCKWVQVVHKDPEELKMFESYSSPNSKGEEKHENEVELCEMADHVVGIGPKLSESFPSYLSGCDKDGNVFDLTPGVFEELKTVKQVSHSDGQQRRVLVFGHGDVEDFKLKGFDIAGKAIAALEDTRLVFVGAPDGKHEEIRKRLIECGVPASRLKVKGFVQDREGLKGLFKQVDLAVMPSRTEGFGLTGLEAMSAGLPVLVSGNSGFGEALCSVAFGSSFVIKSEDPAVWTAAIQKIWSKDRKCRLEEAVSLRDNYGRKYNWANQIKELVDRMVSLTYEDSLNARSSLETKCNASQRMEGITEDHEEPSMEIENNQKRNSYDDEQLVSETFLSSDCERKADSASGNPTEISMNTDSQSQNSRKRKMSELPCNPGTSSEDSGIVCKKHVPFKIASHENASSLRKEPLKSWSMQSLPGSTSSTEPSMEIENNQRANSYEDEQLVSETSFRSDCEMKADSASGNPTKISTNTDSQPQNSRKRKMSEFSCNPEDASDIPEGVSVTEKQPVAKTHALASGFSGEQCPVNEKINTEDAARFSEESRPICHTPSVSGCTSDQETANTVKMSITTRDLSSELEDVVDRILRYQLEVYLKYNKTTKLSTANGLCDFVKHLESTYNFSLTSVGMGSLVINGQCPDLQSLESLWNDYHSGVLNEAAEKLLVTDDIKREINLETVKLKTIIEVDSYLICKKARTEKSGLAGINKTSSQQLTQVN